MHRAMKVKIKNAKKSSLTPFISEQSGRDDLFQWSSKQFDFLLSNVQQIRQNYYKMNDENKGIRRSFYVVATDMRYFERSEFSGNLVGKKIFVLIRQVACSLEQLLCQGIQDTSFEFEETRRKVTATVILGNFVKKP